MPIYTYKIANGETRDIYQHINDDPLCEIDGWPAQRTVQAFKPRTNYGEGSDTDPIRMLSIAVDSEEEVDAFRARNPGVEISRDRGSPLFGIPIAKSRSEKLRILGKEGYVERN